MMLIKKQRNVFAHSMQEKFNELFPEIAEHITRIVPRDENTVTLTRDDGRKYLFMLFNEKWLLERIK